MWGSINKSGRVSPGAFKYRGAAKDPFSTDAKKLTTAKACIERASQSNPDLKFKLAKFPAGLPRKYDFWVHNIPEHGNDAHCNVWSDHREDRSLELAMGAREVRLCPDCGNVVCIVEPPIP